jgi:hypothetical protein
LTSDPPSDDASGQEAVHEPGGGQHGETLGVRDDLGGALERPALREVVPGREQFEARQAVGGEHARLDEAFR